MDRHTSSSSDASTAVESLGWVSSCGTDLRHECLRVAASGEARFARGIWVGKSKIDDTHLVPVEFRWNAEMLQDIRFTPWKPTPRKSAQVVGRNMHITERMIDAHGPTDSCRKCSTGQGNHSALQEKLKQAPIILEESGEQTVVTPAPAASETDTNMMEPSAAPSASERIRQKRGGLHGPEHPDVSEPVQTNVSSRDVCSGKCG